jgi:hypothetical protein
MKSSDIGAEHVFAGLAAHCHGQAIRPCGPPMEFSLALSRN